MSLNDLHRNYFVRYSHINYLIDSYDIDYQRRFTILPFPIGKMVKIYGFDCEVEERS